MKLPVLITCTALLIACQQTTKSADNTSNSPIQVAGNEDYELYCNERFDHCIEYPKGFTGSGVSQNGDGESFFSSDKKTEITFSGTNYMDEFVTLETSYEFVLENYGNVTYKSKKDKCFVVSGTKEVNGETFIFYRKTIYKYTEAVGEVLLTWEIFYPSAQKTTYDAYCKKINEDFK